VLVGPVPDDATKGGLFDGATSAFGAGNVEDQLRVETGTTGPAGEAVAAVLLGLANAPRGWTAIWGDAMTLTLVGEVASQADKAAIVAAATQAFAPGTVIEKLTVSAAGGSSPEIERINREIRLRGVNFVTGSAELTPASRRTLDRIAAILADADAVRAQLQGHTDDQGDAAANQALSARRAQAVVDYLVGKGIARGRLVPRGFGETRPIASNASEAGRAQNRRVVFRRL
jgi:OOP family OmpA-OmpF porin